MEIGQSLEEDNAFMEILREIFGITLAALMGAAVLIGWFMARRALQGLEEVTRTATKIAGGALELRVPAAELLGSKANVDQDKFIRTIGIPRAARARPRADHA